MKLFVILLFLFMAVVAKAVCMSPDTELRGVTKDKKKCEVLINLDEKYISFEAGKQMCTFALDEETTEELKESKKRVITAKGYSNWFDCKVKLFYDEKGRAYKAKISSRLTLALAFHHDECSFEKE